MRVLIALTTAVLIVSACAAPCPTPEPVVQPTPQVIIQTPEPVVQPTPQVIEKVIEVTPAECAELVEILTEATDSRNTVLLDLYSAYTDYPDENLAEFGKRAETILSEADIYTLPDNFLDLVGACLPIGSTNPES